MTKMSEPKTPQQKQQETIARNREVLRKENEVAALERIRKECEARRKRRRRWLRKRELME
jgi:hypothetical protein